MIYLITGTLGTGKTSLAIDMILTDAEGIFHEEKDGIKVRRPLYICHVDGLKDKELKAHIITEDEIQSAPIEQLLPEGSILIVDEADYCYPLRAAGRPVPPYVKTLKELRHYGFTLILMTQHPTFVDPYLRKLVCKHIHLERKALGTKKYEWYRAVENLNATEFANSTSGFYKPSKAARPYFKSSSKHMNFGKKLHWVFIALPLAVLLGLLLSYRAYSSIKAKTEPVQQQAAAVAESPAPVAAPMAASVPLGGKIDDYRPRIANLQETAPIYDNLRQVADYPRRVACIASADSCTCYSQQATPLAGISEGECRAILQDRPFDPYRQPQPQQPEMYQQPNGQGNAPQVVALDGSQKPNLAYGDAPRFPQ